MLQSVRSKALAASTLGAEQVASGAFIRFSSRWSHVEEAPKDPILGVTERFLADPNPEKINLGVGAYRDDNGKPYVLQAVREAEKRVAGREFHEYLPIGGYKPFLHEATKLALGSNADCIKENRVASVQSLSGTGACRLFAEFVRRYAPTSTTYIPAVTWANHYAIWTHANAPQKTYRYYDPATKGLDFAGLMADIKAAPNGSIFLMHACAHNPTGVDPTHEQWIAISQLMKEKNHFAFFDSAYQGFASGDCDRDAFSVRRFLQDGHKIGLAQSFAKNMGLYGQRIGAFSLVCDNDKEAVAVESQMKAIARPMYSNPPLAGALLATHVLRDAELRSLWLQEVKMMADRIISMRTLLKEALEGEGSKQNWSHITSQIGMFCYTGMTPEQVDQLYTQSIYLTRNGRISMAGVNSKNVGRLAKAMKSVTG